MEKSSFLRSNFDYWLDLRVTKDNSRANGEMANKVRLVCIDNDAYPARGINILFRVTGKGASILQSNQPFYNAFTDVNGVIEIDVVDTEEEQIEVSATVQSERENIVYKNMNFIKDSGPLRVTEVINENQSFRSFNEPTSAWSGAVFLIKTDGGSGERIEWRVNQSSAEVSVESIPGNIARVAIKSRPRQICEIEGKDSVTKEVIKYRFQIIFFVEKDYYTLTASGCRKTYGNNVLRADECKTLYSEWGNLSRYAGWRIDRYYWVNEFGSYKSNSCRLNDCQFKLLSNSTRLYTVYKLGSS